MFKKSISIVLTIMIAISMLAFAGCSKQAASNANNQTTTGSAAAGETKQTEPEKKEPVTIKYASFSAGADHAECLDAMIQSFEKDNTDVKVESTIVGYGEHFTQLSTQIAAGNAPDCYELNMENFLAFSVRGAPLELDSFFVKTGTSKDVYSKGVLDACSLNGKLLAIPQSYSTVVLIYNKDLFDKAGVAYPTKDWTWKDELEAARKIKALGDDIWGAFQEVQFWEFYKTVQQNGGSILSPDGKSFTLNSPQNIETLQYMVDRVRVSHVMPSEQERADRAQSDLFKTGNLGMFRGGVWFFTDFANSIKDFKWDVQIEPGNTQKATHFFANVACISKTSKYQEQAFRFINAMASDKSIVNLRLLDKWEIPSVSDPEMLKAYLAKTPPDNKQAVLDSMEYAVKPPALEQFQELIDIVNPKLEAMRTNTRTAKEVLDEAQAEVAQKIVIK